MCTSFAVNHNKTIIGWNLDLLGMTYRINEADHGVYIEILDAREGWLPLFGANDRGDFVGMPTCWPFDGRSDPQGNQENILALDIEFLLQKKTLTQVRKQAETEGVCSLPGVTFMGALSDGEGNVLHIIPGQGVQYYKRPSFSLMTNFSPFKQDRETHPWMGWDRYRTARAMLEKADDSFDVKDAFAILQAVAQTVCPTVVSMVYDVKERTVYRCENREWDRIRKVVLNRQEAAS